MHILLNISVQISAWYMHKSAYTVPLDCFICSRNCCTYIDFPGTPVNIQEMDIEVVKSYKYLGVHLNNRIDWTDNTTAPY